MRTVKLNQIVAMVLVAASLVMTGCATTNTGHSAGEVHRNDTRVLENPLSLRDFLVRAGVTMDFETGVPIIKGGRPLYVVDGLRMGHDYYQVASSVNVNDIASVEVIKDTGRALIYGRDAGNGVILIKTKTGV